MIEQTGQNKTTWEWSAKSLKAVLALAEGKTQEEAAEIAGVARSTIARWVLIPEFQERQELELELMVKEARRILKRNAINAANTVVKQLGSVSRDDAVSLQAAKDLLDRVGLKLPEQIDLTGKLDMKHSADDEQLDSYLAALTQISTAKAAPGRTDDDLA